jgi:hypothetical protein
MLFGARPPVITAFAQCCSSIRTMLIVALMSTVCVSGSGCVESTVAAAGLTVGLGLAQGQAESYIRGELKSARMVKMDKARDAVFAATSELQLTITEERLYPSKIMLRASAEGGREIKVYLRYESPVMTQITIRVGMMGDSAVSRLVMARIDNALGIAASASMPADVIP